MERKFSDPDYDIKELDLNILTKKYESEEDRAYFVREYLRKKREERWDNGE